MKEIKCDETQRRNFLIRALGISILAFFMMVSIASADSLLSVTLADHGKDPVLSIGTTDTYVCHTGQLIDMNFHAYSLFTEDGLADCIFGSLYDSSGREVFFINRIPVDTNGDASITISTSLNSGMYTLYTYYEGNDEIHGYSTTVYLKVIDSTSPNSAASFAYITNSGDGTVSVIDTATDKVTATVDVGRYPYGVAVSSDGKRVYVTDYNTTSSVHSISISVIDTATNTVIATLPIPDSVYDGVGVAVTPDGKKVYVTNGFWAIYAIDTATNTVATIKAMDNPTGIAITPDGKKAYVAFANSEFVFIYDTLTDTLIDYVNQGTENECYGQWGIAINPSGTKAYAVNTGCNNVSVIDISTNTVTSSVDVGSNPKGVAVNPDGTKVYVTNCGGNSVSIIDTATNTVTSSVLVGSSPLGISVTPDGTKVYVANQGSNTVSVIDAATNAVTATVPVGSCPVAFGQFITFPLINTAPIADASEYYEGVENSPVIFDASSSSDPDGDSLQYRWDFESDGEWDTEWSSESKTIHTWNDNWSGSATLEVNDGELNSTDIVTVTISNVNPVVEAGEEQTVNEGDTVSFSGVYSDAGTADTHVISWDFGDGTTALSTLNPSHAYIDNGIYTVTLTVTDDDGGVGSDTVKVTVNNLNPSLDEIVSPIDPASVNTQITTSCTFSDAGFADTHTAVWDWGDGINSPGSIIEINGAGTATGEHAYSDAGIYRVTLTITDDEGGSTSKVAENYVVVYSPEGGFVTGGGWINSSAGAYVPDNTLVGKASFGFVSKYEKGATVPTGKTEFHFKVADLNFYSENYDWLVVSGSQAKFKGTGSINEEGNYGFMLSAVDGAIKGDNIDRFRIKIWDKESQDIIYDNEIGTEEDSEPSTAISGGSIIIHKKK